MAELAHSQSYFEWMRQKVYDNRHPLSYSYKRLLSYLFSTDYHFTLALDANRASDGIGLRYQYAYEHGIAYSDVESTVRNGPCSMLEMMIALAIKCEEMMSNSSAGDRTGQWFWLMIVNLGFAGMPDHSFDRTVANYILSRFFDNQYSPDGHGGLFVIERCSTDLRTVDIFTQMYWYINASFHDEIEFKV